MKQLSWMWSYVVLVQNRAATHCEDAPQPYSYVTIDHSQRQYTQGRVHQPYEHGGNHKSDICSINDLVPKIYASLRDKIGLLRTQNPADWSGPALHLY
jgi:hypothetical protein